MTAAVIRHPAAQFTRADAAAWLLGRSCEGCGTRLPGPGQPCEACGKLPAVTAPELEEQLAGPRALLAVEVAKLRAEAGELREQMLAKYREADRRILMQGLTEVRAEAQAALDAETARGAELTHEVMAAERAEAKAAKALAAAAGRLRPRQAALAEATAAREAAGQAVREYKARVEQLEQARDTAAAVCDQPPRIPYSFETISADPVNLAMSGVLDDVEMVMGRFAVRALAMVTGADEAIGDEAKRELLAQQERDAPHRQAIWKRADRNGNVTVIANPGGHPDVPTHSSPPVPGTRPPGFSPPLIPGLGS